VSDARHALGFDWHWSKARCSGFRPTRGWKWHRRSSVEVTTTAARLFANKVIGIENRTRTQNRTQNTERPGTGGTRNSRQQLAVFLFFSVFTTCFLFGVWQLAVNTEHRTGRGRRPKGWRYHRPQSPPRPPEPRPLKSDCFALNWLWYPGFRAPRRHLQPPS
jgi:hypothetical protein